MGKSTVGVDGEIYKGEPVGLGPRVPMLIVSPWTTGGFVNSELFDHTSVIRFLETRFGVQEPNITPWRRAVCGDLDLRLRFFRPGRTKGSRPAQYGRLCLSSDGAASAANAAATGRSLPAKNRERARRGLFPTPWM